MRQHEGFSPGKLTGCGDIAGILAAMLENLLEGLKIPTPTSLPAWKRVQYLTPGLKQKHKLQAPRPLKKETGERLITDNNLFPSLHFATPCNSCNDRVKRPY